MPYNQPGGSYNSGYGSGDDDNDTISHYGGGGGSDAGANSSSGDSGYGNTHSSSGQSHPGEGGNSGVASGKSDFGGPSQSSFGGHSGEGGGWDSPGSIPRPSAPDPSSMFDANSFNPSTNSYISRGDYGGVSPDADRDYAAAMAAINSLSFNDTAGQVEDSRNDRPDAWSGTSGLRGLTGPLGQPMNQPTSYGNAYQTAQMMRSAYPNIAKGVDQSSLAQGLSEFQRAMPGESFYDRYTRTGQEDAAMRDVGRVGLNKIIGGMSPRTMLSHMDTTGIRPGTEGFSEPGPNSMGMVGQNSPDAYKASVALRDALTGTNVSPTAQWATNFVAAGTPMVKGVTPIGEPEHGTQFGYDPNWGMRVPNAQKKAQASLDDIMGGRGMPNSAQAGMPPAASLAPPSPSQGSTPPGASPKAPSDPSRAIPPSQYEPPSTKMGTAMKYGVNGIASVIPGLNLASAAAKLFGYDPGEIAQRDYDAYSDMTPEQKVAWQDRRAAQGAYERRRIDEHGGMASLVGGGGNSSGDGGEAGSDDTEGVVGGGGFPPSSRKRIGTPSDIFNYGLNPEYSYFKNN